MKENYEKPYFEWCDLTGEKIQSNARKFVNPYCMATSCGHCPFNIEGLAYNSNAKFTTYKGKLRITRKNETEKILGKKIKEIILNKLGTEV